jgi:hypothetical protein
VSEKKRYMQLTLNGSGPFIVPITKEFFVEYFWPELENVYELEDKFEISFVEMTEEEHDNLPEWDGF